MNNKENEIEHIAHSNRLQGLQLTIIELVRLEMTSEII